MHPYQLNLWFENSLRTVPSPPLMMQTTKSQTLSAKFLFGMVQTTRSLLEKAESDKLETDMLAFLDNLVPRDMSGPNLLSVTLQYFYVQTLVFEANCQHIKLFCKSYSM